MKFLVVDDHALIRDAMRTVLRGLRPDAVVLEAGSAAEGLALAAGHGDVDLVLLDVNLPDRDGLDVLAEMRRLHPATSVVMLSAEREASTVKAALGAGAVGFIPKAETRDVLVSALGLVLAGGTYIPPMVLRGGAGASPPAHSAATTPSAESLGLTGRQMDVLRLMMLGRSNKLICRELDLAEPTVKAHVSAILRALGVDSRTEAVLAVTRLGWKPGDAPPG